jgi:glutathionylspermidine synthase
MITDSENKIAPFNEIQGIASTNVPAYSNEYDDFIAFEGFYVHGIFTGFKWQCVEFARRWLLLRKSCIFQNVGSAADMWQELKYVECVTDGRKFPIKTYSNGCSAKPQCDSFLIYPRSDENPFGHIAVICEVQEDFIRVAEQNYQFHYWSNNYSRQIPMIKHNDLYYIEDYYNVYGWMVIENNDQLKPLNQSILQKYQQSKPIGKLEHCFISNENFDLYNEKLLIQSNDKDRSYYKADEDFLLNISSTSNELYRLFMQVTENIIHNDELLIGFGIPKQFWSQIRRSWTNERHFDIIGHLDFKFDGKKLKLCQYKTENGLTILESAVIQEKRAQIMDLNYDFTSSFQLHRLLVKNWKRLNIKTTIHILIDNNQEEMMIALYMKKIMTEADIDSKLCILPNDLYWKDSNIVDKDDQIVKIVWKLWNWKMIFQDYLDRYCDDGKENGWKSMNDKHPCLNDILLNQQIRIIEPIWKSITTHTSFLPVLYRMFPNHLNISQDQSILSEDSKEISFVNSSMDADVISYDSMSGYFDDHYIPQQSKNFSEHSDKTIVSWIINDLFSGFSICDEQNQITDANNFLTYCCII